MDGERDNDTDAEPVLPENLRWTERAAELVLANEVLPGPAAIPDLARLRSRMRAPSRRSRLLWGGAALTAAGAMGALLVIAARPARPDRPTTLSYVVEGAATVQGDSVEAPGGPATASAGETGRMRSGAATRLRFTDGTAIVLAPGARLRVPARTAAGASLILDRGRADFTVVHRRTAAWRVTAGPFQVEVTGTRFNVSWDARRGLRLDLESGGVVVRGAGTGPGIKVHPGETLTGAAVGGRVTVAPTAQVPREGPTGTDVTAGSPVGERVSSPPATAASPSATSTSVSAAISDRPRGRSRDATSTSAGTLALATPSRTVAAGMRSAPEMRPDLQPPAVTPSAPSLISGGGGVFCARERPGLGFESEQTGVYVPRMYPQVYHMAFQNPRQDTTHSWCGIGSARLDVDFNERGRQNFMGRLPNQSGQIVFTLPHLMDFTDKTVSLHVFFDGPTDARVAAQLYVIHHGKWVNGPVVDQMVPRRWWTVSHTFRAENPLTVGPPYPPAGTSLVTDCDRIALVVYSTGGPRTWSGAVYVDDVNWR